MYLYVEIRINYVLLIGYGGYVHPGAVDQNIQQVTRKSKLQKRPSNYISTVLTTFLPAKVGGVFMNPLSMTDTIIFAHGLQSYVAGYRSESVGEAYVQLLRLSTEDDDEPRSNVKLNVERTPSSDPDMMTTGPHFKHKQNFRNRSRRL